MNKMTIKQYCDLCGQKYYEVEDDLDKAYPTFQEFAILGHIYRRQYCEACASVIHEEIGQINRKLQELFGNAK